jgi:hypothetical protein
VWNDLAFLLVLEVVHVDVDRAALGPIVRAAVLGKEFIMPGV